MLPDKTTSLKNELARLQSTLHSTKSQNATLEESLFFILLSNPIEDLLAQLFHSYML